jgi:hypothetical protein
MVKSIAHLALVGAIGTVSSTDTKRDESNESDFNGVSPALLQFECVTINLQTSLAFAEEMALPCLFISYAIPRRSLV